MNKNTSFGFRATPRLVVCLLAIVMTRANAINAYYDQKCASCHGDDSVTCNGCHQHGGYGLDPQPDKPEYAPGDKVRISFDGGRKYGWGRGRLEDAGGTEISRRTGPTFSGDDGIAPVEFPMELIGRAPGEAGEHRWSSRYFGNDNGWGHGEIEVETLIRVGATAPVVVDAIPGVSPWFFTAEGGEGVFEIELRNTTDHAVELDVWIQALLSSGHEVGPLLPPLELTIPANVTGVREVSLTLPGAAPSGVYSLEVLGGRHQAGEVFDADSFAFVKRP